MKLIKAFGSLILTGMVFAIGGYVKIPVLLGYCFFILSIVVGAYAIRKFHEYIKDEEDEKNSSSRN